MAYCIVPITVSGEAEDRSFAATRWKAKAAVQIAGSTSLSWQAPAQLYPTATSLYERNILPEITARNGATHLTVAAFAPIPMLMKLSALLGDKFEATVLVMPGARWLWDMRPECPAPQFAYDVPERMPREVAAVVSISNRAIHPADLPVVEFRAVDPNRAIIRTESHVQAFRREFNDFLMRLVRSGVRILHMHPATPLCASVEIGRMILPKTFEEVHVWEWQAPQWRSALRLK